MSVFSIYSVAMSLLQRMLRSWGFGDLHFMMFASCLPFKLKAMFLHVFRLPILAPCVSEVFQYCLRSNECWACWPFADDATMFFYVVVHTLLVDRVAVVLWRYRNS